MELVKKNMVSIICLVVALAAVGVAFTMLPSRAAALQTQLDGRKSAYEAMNSLLHKQRQLPSVNPDNPNAQEPLPQFPSPKIIEAGTAITKQVEDESHAIVEAAKKMNAHELLVPNCLPSPSTGDALSFRNAYVQALPPATTGPDAVKRSRFAQQLNAGMPPTAEDIRVEIDKLTLDLKKKIFINAQGQPTNQEQVQQELTERSAQVPKELMERAASNSRVYVNPDTFEIYPAIATSAGAPDPIHIYYAQLGFWIQQDVVNAVNEANAGSKSIMDSPVKHLISIRAKTGGAPNFIAIPGQANADPDAALTKNPVVSPTGRVSNGLYDVFHFTVVADVEANKVSHFLRALGNHRFITPLWVEVRAVDNANALSEGHAYGEKPMLNLTVECETLYMRAWNARNMPASIKTLLGIPVEGAAPAAPAAPAPTAAAAP